MKTAFAAVALIAIAAVPATAQDADNSIARDGIRLEARATWETPTVSSVVEDDDVFKLGQAVAFGGEAGFDLAVSNELVAGPYANYELSNVENCDGADCVSVKDNFAAGLHLGYALGADGQLYGKVGYAVMKLEAEVAGLQDSESGSGFQFAVGYEHGLGRNLYGRVEFGYGDNGEIYGINFQRRHASVALGARF